MGYLLAKELQEAGFPQDSVGDSWCLYQDGSYGIVEKGHFAGSKMTHEYPIPTLEDLIAACGDDIYNLSQIEDGSYTDGRKMWWAAGKDVEAGGETATIAVARLWLALNKN